MSTDTYLGNKNLKSTDVPIEFTKETVQEYLKCSQKPDYFLLNYVRIVSVDEGLIPFKTWKFQKTMVNSFNDNRFVICKLPRQVGKTTTVAAFILWKILFTEQYSVAILANKMAQARETVSYTHLRAHET